MNKKKITANLLTAFILLSIGVAIGREMERATAVSGSGTAAAQGDMTVVYYMHGIPCVTCMFIETTAQTLVREEFADELDAGQLAFVTVNYLDSGNAALADRFNVGENLVIAVHIRDGIEVRTVRMDRVMEMAADEESLRDYLRQGIRTALAGDGQ